MELQRFSVSSFDQTIRRSIGIVNTRHKSRQIRHGVESPRLAVGTPTLAGTTVDHVAPIEPIPKESGSNAGLRVANGNRGSTAREHPARRDFDTRWYRPPSILIGLVNAAGSRRPNQNGKSVGLRDRGELHRAMSAIGGARWPEHPK